MQEQQPDVQETRPARCEEVKHPERTRVREEVERPKTLLVVFLGTLLGVNSMWDVAYAQSSGSSGGMFESLGMLPPMILIFAVFYFLLIRPQQKKAREHKDMLGQLKRNDEVMTTGGVFGKVTAINDSDLTLEVAPNVRIRVSRGHIAQLFRSEKAAPKEVKAKS